MADKKPIVDYLGKQKEIAIGDKIPIANLATGTPDGTKFIRDDGTLASPEINIDGGDPSEVYGSPNNFDGGIII